MIEAGRFDARLRDLRIQGIHYLVERQPGTITKLDLTGGFYRLVQLNS